jgi:succinate dehydrogenase / fumarate reductase cytochrome b subunit
MAITGLFMVLFVVGHLLGNLSIFAGPDGINAYAAKLQELGPVVWVTRIVMGVSVLLHAGLGVQVTTENSAAKPTKYAVDRHLRATFSSKTMIWTGVILAAFIVYHLLHFTFRVTPNLVLGVDAANRFDVFTMVTSSMKGVGVAVIYVVGMVALFLHLSHGIQSTFQTLGVSNNILLPRYGLLGKIASAAFLVGYGSIPVLILVGIL